MLFRKLLSCLAFAAAFVSLPLFAEMKLSFLYQDNMVFCANKPAFVKGTASSGETVTVTLLGKTYSAKADEMGKFHVDLGKLPVIKTPFEIVVQGEKDKVVLHNVLSGIVLLAGGQSNMEVKIKEALNPEEEVATADYPAIREFRVKHDFDFVPRESLDGKWTVVSPKTAREVGAISFYTARMLHKELDGVPVGIINNSVSASPQEAWLPEDSAHKYGVEKRVKIYDKYKPLGRQGLIEKRESLEKTVILTDSGNDGEKNGWHKVDFDDSAWKDITIPAELEEVFGNKDGAYWFRRVVDLPEECAGKDLELELGTVDDYDITYFNGEVVGRTGVETPDPWSVRRFYTVPGKLVKAGKNILAVRCFDARCGGGLYDRKMNLKLDDKIVFNLHGKWKATAERVLDSIPYPEGLFEMICTHRMATGLYNAMMAPLRGTPVNAILWYQGETNSGDGAVFGEMFKECIRVWRRDLNDEKNEIPFLFVQLAAYRNPEKDANKCSGWALTRDLQAQARTMPNVHMVPAIDIGDAKHIHPKNKQEVGRRLALWLLQDYFKAPKFADAVAYPEIDSAKMSKDGKKIELKVKNAEGLKTIDGKAPHSFAVCGQKVEIRRKGAKLMEETYRFADAEIQGDTIIVTVPAGTEGTACTVRYGWMQNPEVNVVNGKGFPLLPGSFDLK